MEMIATEKKGIETGNKDYRVEVKIVANPDNHQYFRPMKLTISGASLADLKRLQKQFIDESFDGVSSDLPIGGGNWSSQSFVFGPDGKKIGYMSYNGRIWDKNKNEVFAI